MRNVLYLNCVRTPCGGLSITDCGTSGGSLTPTSQDWPQRFAKCIGLSQEAEVGRVRTVHRALIVVAEQMFSFQVKKLFFPGGFQFIKNLPQRSAAGQVAVAFRAQQKRIAIAAIFDQQDRRVRASKQLVHRAR